MTDKPLPQSHSPDPNSDDRRWRLAVLGLGRRGLEYAAAVARDSSCDLAGLVDSRNDLRGFARGCGFQAPLAVSLARLLERGPLAGVIVCAPPREVPALACRAIEAGLAVLIPGPPAADLAGADKLAAALSAASRPVASGNAALTHPLFARAAHVLAEGSLGAIVSVRASVQVSRVFGPASLPPAGDVLDHVALDLVMLLDLLFGPAHAVSARAERLYGDTIDEAHVTLELGAGPPISFDCSWSVPGYPRAAMVLEVECKRGRVLASDDALELEREGTPATQRTVLAGLIEGHPLEWGEAHATLQEFTRRLSHGMQADDPLDLARGLRAVRVLDAIRGSAATAGGSREVPA
ncbi:MAG: Gfo/Idh/MocA family oxidoreductase [Candidatus Eisenbacteria bacterium]